MLGIYLLHVPGQKWRNECRDRIFKMSGREPLIFQGLPSNHPDFNEQELPITTEGLTFINGHLGHVGHVACVDGHRKILKHFLHQTQDPYAALFEDDVMFPSWVRGSHFEEAARRVSALDPEWDWMMTAVPHHLTPNPAWIEGTERLDNIFRCSAVSVGTHCYMVSRRGAAKLLERSSIFYQPWDMFTVECGDARVYHGPELGDLPTDEVGCFSIIEASPTIISTLPTS